MIQSILSLTKKLISVESTKDNLQGLREVVEIAKGELSGITIEEFNKNDSPSILVYKGPKGQRRFKALLDAHLDVVAGNKNQFTAVEKNGRLYGRGTDDMKAAAAVELLVFKEVVGTVLYPLALQIVTDEEIGGYNGAKYQIEQGVRADFSLAGEPTSFGINNEAKGVIWAKIKTKGVTGHGAYLWLGQNALWKLNTILRRIQKAFPIPQKESWKTTVNLAKIETNNNTFNKIPDEATAWIDVRFIPADTQIVEEMLKSLVGSDGELDLLENEPSQFTEKSNMFIRKLSSSVNKITKHHSKIIVKHGASDIRHFTSAGCAGVTFGPIGAGLHSDEEWVDIKSLEHYYLILKDFLLSI